MKYGHFDPVPGPPGFRGESDHLFFILVTFGHVDPFLTTTQLEERDMSVTPSVTQIVHGRSVGRSQFHLTYNVNCDLKVAMNSHPGYQK